MASDWYGNSANNHNKNFNEDEFSGYENRESWARPHSFENETSSINNHSKEVLNINQSPVLHFLISKVTQNITVDSLYAVCNREGCTVQRIVICDVLQDEQITAAMIEFKSVEDAEKIFVFADGRDMFQDSCRIKAAFASVVSLNVTENNDLMWNYELQMTSQEIRPPYGQLHQPISNTHNDSTRLTLRIANVTLLQLTCDRVFNLFSQYGKVDCIRIGGILSKDQDFAYVQMQTQESVAAAYEMLNHSSTGLLNRNFGLLKVTIHEGKFPHTKGEHDNPNFKSYIGSELNHEPSKKKYFPNKALYFCGAPLSMTTEQLKAIVCELVPTLPFMEIWMNSNNPRYLTGFLKFGMIEDALNVLLACSNVIIPCQETGTQMRIRILFTAVGYLPDPNVLGEGMIYDKMHREQAIGRKNYKKRRQLKISLRKQQRLKKHEDRLVRSLSKQNCDENDLVSRDDVIGIEVKINKLLAKPNKTRKEKKNILQLQKKLRRKKNAIKGADNIIDEPISDDNEEDIDGETFDDTFGSDKIDGYQHGQSFSQPSTSFTNQFPSNVPYLTQTSFNNQFQPPYSQGPSSFNTFQSYNNPSERYSPHRTQDSSKPYGF